MISYPTSKLHNRLSSEKSSNCDDTNSICSSVNSSIYSSSCSTSNIIHDSSCESKYSINNWDFCNNEQKCRISDFCAKEIYPHQKEESCEKIIKFSENHTSGILKITQIKGNLGTGILKIISGNYINLNNKIFDGLLNISIIIDGNENVNIKFNGSEKIQMSNSHYIILKRKNNCKWELVSFYELKNMSQNYYYKTKNICSQKDKEEKDCSNKNECKIQLYDEKIIFENKKCNNEKTKCDRTIKICSISSNSSNSSCC
jgi:hypothetical protein